MAEAPRIRVEVADLPAVKAAMRNATEEIERLRAQCAEYEDTLARVRRFAHYLREHQGVTGLMDGAALLRVLDEGWSPDDLPEPF